MPSASNPATPAGAPYRRRLVRLPLQRSLFYEIDRAADLLGLAGALPGGRFGARVDGSGDLFIDPGHVEQLSSALLEDLEAHAVETMLQRHRNACRALLDATREAPESAGALDGASVGCEIRRLGGLVSVVLAYGILARFVPDVLLRALRATGDASPLPLPRPSSGTGLSRDLARLFLECDRLGYGPRRLAESWPEVNQATANLVLSFSSQHTGFGPLAWEAPGYEDPAYTVRAVRVAFDGVEPGRVRDALRTRHARRDPGPPPGLPALLAFWLDFLETETWYVRRSFFLAIAPLARRLGEELRTDGLDLGPDGPLFLELDELAGLTPRAGLAEALHRRRGDYLAGETDRREATRRLRSLLEPW